MPLTRRQIIELARLIEERRAALAEEIHRDVARSRDEPYAATAGTAPDVVDEANADLLADVATAETNRDIDELRAFEAAHERIAKGTYGECVDCGDDVPFERLLAEPEAARCITCQERHEKTFRK